MKKIPNHSEEATKKSPTSQLWAGQKTAFTELLEIGQLALFGDWFSFPIKPRLTPLVIGPSGVGKSHLLRALSAQIGVKCLRLTASNWTVINAVKGVTPTMQQVYEFVSQNEKCIIHVDELCKFRLGSTSNDWAHAVVGEAFDLLDRTPCQPAKNMKWTRDLLLRLKQDCWIVGTGTWQNLWTQCGRPMVGFQEKEDTASLVAKVRRAVRTSEVIPDELLRRFGELIVLGPASEEEFRQAAESLGVKKLATELGVQLDYAHAVRSQLGARWLEQSMGQLLLQARRLDRTDLIPHRPFIPDIEPAALDDFEPEVDSSPL